VLDLYVRAAGTGALGIVAEVHPALPELSPALRARYSLLRGARLDSWAHRKYRQAYGKSTMRELGLRPVMNAGVFALHREAPHWAAWEESYRLALARRNDIWVNQISLNHAVYRKDLPVQLLPLRCNWPCSAAMPSYDPDRDMYVEPYLPHDPLGIVHMTWDTKYGSFDLATPDGGHVRRGLGYPRRPAEPARGR
jgi:hypothetical protein